MKKNGRNKKCEICNKEFYVPFWREKYNPKYCSNECYYKSKCGKEPWNKGIKSGNENGGSFVSKEKSWKGTLKEYKKLHYWVSKYLGKPNKCELCSKKEFGKKIHWANVSGNYKKQKGDWIRLCSKCHYIYDKQNKRRKKYN